MALIGLRHRYHGVLEIALEHRRRFHCRAFLLFVIVSLLLLGPWLGSDFFPAVDAGQIKLHMRAQTGTRVEETAALCDAIDAAIRRVIPATEIERIVDNVGLPISGTNLLTAIPRRWVREDADIFISLTPDHHPTADYVRKLRDELTEEMPDIEFRLPARRHGRARFSISACRRRSMCR